MLSPWQEDCEADVSIISTCCHAFVVFNLLSCFSRFQLAVTLYIRSVQFPDNAKPMSRWMRSRCQYNAKPMSRRMRSRCQDKCEADVKLNAKPMSGWMRSRCQYNAKPMSRRMRSRCQYYSAKPMSKQMRSRCQDECEADVDMMRSLCQGECEADVKTNAKPMSGRPRSRCREGSHKWKHAVCEAYAKKNAKPMPVLFCGADVKAPAKPMSRRHPFAHAEWKYRRTQTIWRQMETRGQICFIYGRIN